MSLITPHSYYYVFPGWFGFVHFHVCDGTHRNSLSFSLSVCMRLGSKCVGYLVARLALQLVFMTSK